jgi:hypothetical protein
VVVIVLKLDLQLPVQSVPITTKVVSSNLVHDEVYSVQDYVIKLVSDLRQVSVFSFLPHSPCLWNILGTFCVNLKRHGK